MPIRLFKTLNSVLVIPKTEPEDSLIWVISPAQAASTSAADDELVGPFASWINVKTACGAKGDGTTDYGAATITALQ
jgi:hypothetical protein